MRGNAPSPPPVSLYLDRRLFHMFAASVFPLAAFLLGRTPAIALAAGAGAALVVVEVARLRSEGVNRWVVEWLGILLKPGEERRVTAATYLAVSALATLLLFPMPVAGIALLYVGLGDPAAALVGSRFGRHRWPGLVRRGPLALPLKSLEGTLAFLAVSLGVGLLLWGKGAFTPYWPAAVGALVAAAVESLPLPIDDNLTVPLASGVAMGALWAL